MYKFFSIFVVTLIVPVTVISCGSTRVPKEALALTPESLENRKLQTRRFDTQDEKKLLISATGLLQDIGYTVEESERGLGVLVASKDRDATDAGQVTASVITAVLFGVATPVDKIQKIRASVVTHPGANDQGVYLRITFQRIVWNDRGMISRRESIEDPAIYLEFFAALSKAVFLEAHEI